MSYLSKIKRFKQKNHRELIVIIFFLISVGIIIKTIFSYTITNHSFYVKKADFQHNRERTLKVTRGTIYNYDMTQNSPQTSAVSTSFYNFAIDPTSLGDEKRFIDFFTNIIYEHLCLHKKDNQCQKNMAGFLKNKDFIETEFYSEPEYLKEIIQEGLKEKLKNKKITSILVQEELNNEQKFKIENLALEGVFIIRNNLYFNPENIVDRDIVASRISNILNIENKKILLRTQKKEKRYLPIIKNIKFSLYDKIIEFKKNEIDLLKQGIIKEKKDLIGPSFILESHPSRFYPENTLASQVIGFVNNSGIGHYGAEGFFENDLKGEAMKIKVKKDSKGRELGISYSDKEKKSTVFGKDIQLTIDRNVQQEVEAILEKGVKKYKANKGTIIVVNPKNGEIIAMANYPTYDPNNYGDVYDLERLKMRKYSNPATDLRGIPILVPDRVEGEPHYFKGEQLYLKKVKDNNKILFRPGVAKYTYLNKFGAGVYINEAISSLYEPGSIMKAITVAVGIDTGEIKANEFYYDKGFVTVGRFKIYNVSAACLGNKTYGNALNYSCNVGMIDIARKMGKSLFHDYLKEFGFGELTRITLEGEVSGKIIPYEKWTKAKLFTTSYGLGISVTPLQMTMAYAAIANGGILYRAKILKSISYNDNGKKIIVEPKPDPVRRVLKESTSKIVTQMLVDSINIGVAKNAKVPGYLIAGKTGTSDIASKGTYEKGVGSTNASFVGYGPAQDPKFVILVKLRRPRTVQYGGESSAFMFADLSKYLLDYYGISKNLKQ